MNNQKYARFVLVAVLCLAMILPFVSIPTEAAVNNFAAASTGFQGKKLSILGDSISTYSGISNNTSANSTIGSNVSYYPGSIGTVKSAAETWWMQTIDTLGMDLCVNNSWSGSCATDRGSGNSVAYKYDKRCMQLHNNTGSVAVNPDIIAIYLGTNDIKNITSDAQLKSASGNSYPMGATMNTDGTATVTFSYSNVTGNVSSSSYVPGSILEAYALMVYRVLNKYQSAEIYCFTLLPNETQNQYNREMYALYNAGIRAIVEHFNNIGKKIYLVDLYQDTGITYDPVYFGLYLENELHPNPLGMDAITNCFLSSLVANSQYSVKEQNEVIYDLNDAYVTTGKVTSATTEEKFSVSLKPTHSQYGLKVKVTMNGADVTASSYSAGTVLIDKVTGPITIKAEAVYETRNYRWELKDGALKSCVPDGKDYHVSGEIDTKELVLKNGSYTNGSFSKAQYSIPDAVVLRNEEPWVLEWKGTNLTDNVLFTEKSSHRIRNDNYLYFGTTHLGFGFRKTYNNGYISTDSSGTKIYEYPAGHAHFSVDISGLELDNVNGNTYRLVNKISGNSNTVHLYVDNKEIGALNQYYSKNENMNCTDDWISGKDFVFSFMGSTGEPDGGGNVKLLNQCSFDYIQVWEGGDFDTQRLAQLRQEFQDLMSTVSGHTGYDAYRSAVDNANAFANSQEQCDAYADVIVSARNELTQACDSSTSSGEILSVDLVTGDYARIGKQVGLRIITAPDVARISVGSEQLSSVSAMIQTMKLYKDGAYQDALVKVWLVTFNHGITSDQTVTYTVNTYLAENTAEMAAFDKTVSFQ